jgi:hypothetical protein
MWILWKREKSLEKYFPVSLGYSMVSLHIVPGMHLDTFIRIVEKIIFVSDKETIMIRQ